MIKQRIENIRDLMKEKNIYAYIVPSSDYHQSEYVGDYFKSREFMSGFTGSAGTLIISMDEAGLWTDASAAEGRGHRHPGGDGAAAYP